MLGDVLVVLGAQSCACADLRATPARVCPLQIGGSKPPPQEGGESGMAQCSADSTRSIAALPSSARHIWAAARTRARSRATPARATAAQRRATFAEAAAPTGAASEAEVDAQETKVTRYVT